jgi:hypothetical protein
MLFPNGRACVLLIAALGCGLAGCASWSVPTVPMANIATDQYLGMTCPELKSEKTRIATRQGQLAPTLFPVEDEQKREQELSQLSGETKAIEKASASNKCN